MKARTEGRAEIDVILQAVHTRLLLRGNFNKAGSSLCRDSINIPKVTVSMPYRSSLLLGLSAT